MGSDSVEHYNVLLIDDDEDDYLITKKIFSRIPNSPFTLEWVPSLEAAKRYIDSDAYDIYLVDYRLGEQTGFDVLEYAEPQRRRQPFIFLTGVGDSKLEMRSLKMAAADYLVKGTFDETSLSRTLFYAVQRKAIERQRVEHLIELNQSKDEFISIASHQLRTPATGVKQYLGMVIEGFAGDVSPKQHELLIKAYESNERQLRIVSDLLKVARVDSGKMKLHMQDTDINHLLQDVIEEQMDTVRSRNQSVSFSTQCDDTKLRLDSDVFRMVFENIIDNASKYSPEDTSIEVTIKHREDTVCITVADHGVGIHPKDRRRMFEKFSRIDNALSTKVGGTGLGLYWAKRIIDMHHGTIEYEPNKPDGSCFTICLPIGSKKTVM